MIWRALTALSVLLFIATMVVVVWSIGWVLQRLTPVLLPLAIAGIMAYLLDPVVDGAGVHAQHARDLARGEKSDVAADSGGHRGTLRHLPE